MFDKLNQNQKDLYKSNMGSIYGESELVKSAADFLEKGKKANLGEVREWNGVKYQKTTQGWIKAGKPNNSNDNGGELSVKEESRSSKLFMSDASDKQKNFVKDLLSDKDTDKYTNDMSPRQALSFTRNVAGQLGITEKDKAQNINELEKMIKEKASKLFKV